MIADYLAEKRGDTLTHLQRNLKELWNILESSGVTDITVIYSGCGDSGCVDDITFTPAAPQILIPFTSTVGYYSAGKWEEKEVTKDITIEEFVKELCYELLTLHHPGWEINDGSSGTFTFNVKEKSIHLGHHEYYTESDYTETTITNAPS